MSEVYNTYQSALKGYSEKLRKLSLYDDLGLIDLLKNDLISEALHAERLYTDMSKALIHQGDFEDGFIKDERDKKVLCNALRYYSKYLNDCIDTIQKSLGIDDIASEETKKQLDTANQKYDDLCKKSKD
jgi:hypothetical protein